MWGAAGIGALLVALMGGGIAAAADTAGHEAPALQQQAPPVVVVPPRSDVDVNRPRTTFDCELPIGQNWYGSRERCLAQLCSGENVYNEYIFDADSRRRKNPCYGQNPTEFPE